MTGVVRPRVSGFRALLLPALAAVAIPAGEARGQFTTGNVVVERVGGTASFGGAASQGSAATAVFLDQFTPTTTGQTPVNTVSLPTTAGGGQLALTDSGSATSNGYLTRTADGTTLLLSGYNAAVGTASVASSSPATVNRTVGVVGLDGTANTATGFDNGPSNNFRGVASASGSSFYASTAGTATTPGVLYVPPANVGAVANATAILNGNTRNLFIGNGSLFASSASANPGVGINLVGTAGALPTAAAAATLLPGTGSLVSPYGFQLIDNPGNANNWNGTGFDTLYVADDSENGTVGGLTRWEFNGATWAVTGDNLFFDAAIGARGLTVVQNGTNVTLFLTTDETAQNRLVQVADDLASTTPFAGGFITLATAPANTAFRGVALAPVPEPATVLGVAAAALGGATALRRRFRKGDHQPAA